MVNPEAETTGPTLVYFEGEDHRPATDPTGAVGLHVRYTRTRATGGGLQRITNYEDTYFDERGKDLLPRVAEAMFDPRAWQAPAIYTIHPKSLLLRMFCWAGRSQGLPPAHTAHWEKYVRSRSVDVCEMFHYPAVLTYEARVDFDPSSALPWVGGTPTGRPMNDLHQLCELWM